VSVATPAATLTMSVLVVGITGIVIVPLG